MKSTHHFSALALLFALSATACADPYEDPLPRRDRLNWPIGLAVHPSGDYLYVVNSNFDTRYAEDVGGTLSVIDLESLEIRDRNSPFLPSFGGFVRLNGDASRAYVSARHSNTIVAFDVAPDGASVFCRDGDETTSDPTSCALRRVPDIATGARIPSDPFALDVVTLDWTGPDGDEFEIDLLNVAHLRGESVTAIAIPRTGSDSVPASMESAALVPGGSVLARRPGTRDIYVGGRESRNLVAYFPYLSPAGSLQAIVRRGSVALGNIGQTVSARGLSFSPDGEQLYAATRAPAALHVVDLGPSNPETGGGTLRKVSASIPLPRNPSGVHTHTRVDGKTLLYVPSFGEERIAVVDPESRTVVDEIEIGAQPYDFVVDRGLDRCVADAPCRAYVSLFNDLPFASGTCGDHETEPCGSVGIIELDPESPRYHQLIGKIN